MTTKSTMSFCFLAALALTGAACTTTPAATCSPINCTNGCCDSSGTCVLDETSSACGLNASACVQCTGATACDYFTGSCLVPAPDAGLDGGDGTDAGADAGVDPCALATYGAALGTLRLDGGAHLGQYAALPPGVVAIGLGNGQLYGVGVDYAVRGLGSLPTLALGAAVGRARSPDDDATDAAVYLGESVSVHGTQLLVGYSRADFSGELAIVELGDAGTRWLAAPGNYTTAVSSTGFLVNGQGLGATNGTGVWALETVDGGSGGFLVAPFESSWMASSGYTAVTPAGVVLAGYFDGSSYQNVVRAVSPALAAAALTGRAPLSLSASSSEVLRGSTIQQLTALGESMIVVYGGYDSSSAPYTTGVVRIPLVVSGSTVSTGTPVTLLTAPDRCTTVTFLTSDGATLLLGVTDKNGRRVLELAP